MSEEVGVITVESVVNIDGVSKESVRIVVVTESGLAMESTIGFIISIRGPSN